MRLTIDARRTGRALMVTVITFNVLAFLVLAATDVLGWKHSELARQFDVAEEGNLTAWFSALLLFGGAVLCAAVATGVRQRGERDAGWWWAMAAGFVYLSLDEAAALHEIVIGPIGRATDASGFLKYAWIIVAVPAVVIVFLIFLGFLRRLPSKTRNAFLIAGAVFLAGAVVVEALGGEAMDSGLVGHGVNRLFVSVEECLENVGAVLFIAAVLRYMAGSTAGAMAIDVVARVDEFAAEDVVVLADDAIVEEPAELT
jgi:hypothetical protein